MSVITQKLSIGIAAGAMAAAATLTPVTVASVAHAESPSVGVLGQSFAQADCDPTAGFCAESVAQAANTPGSIVRSVFQNDLWWIGRANPNPPARSNIFVFTPLSLVPGFLKPAYSWFTQNLNFQACFLGATVTVGPYGTTSLSVGRGCK